MKRTLSVVASCALLVAMTATPSAAQPLDDPIPTSIKPGGIPLRLEPVTAGLTAPN